MAQTAEDLEATAVRPSICSQPAPRISVVVPAYGVGELLAEALASLQAQDLADWEALVVDDGDPEVARVFARFAGDPRLKLLRTENGGVSAARNRGVAAAGGAFIALLDGDDVYEPSYLRRMLAALEADPRLGFVACDALLFGQGERGGRRFSDQYPLAGAVTLERVLARRTNIFTAAVVRRRALDAVGGFDPQMCVAEDLDLWVRLLAAGWGGAILAEPLVRYRRRPGSLSSGAGRLLAGTGAVYRKAQAALAGRPEAEVARAMAERCEERFRWEEGEALILRGEIQAGLALLRRAEARSPRWRLALGVMRKAPWLAAWLIRLRAWLPRPRRA